MKTGKNIVQFLKDNKIEKIDYLVGTHNHEDHIGGLDDIVENFDIGNIYMPTIANDAPNYLSVKKQADKKNYKIISPKKGDKLDFGEAKCEVMEARNDPELNINNSSIVIQIDYKDRKFLFTGDAEKEIEKSRKWDKVDVLKVGHHGSGTSSCQEFLDQVNPTYSIIEVGKDNRYRLPNKKTMERLEKLDTTIYRTDTNESSFYLRSDGDKIEIKEVKINLDGNK